MTEEKTPTLEELEASLRHYNSYDAALQSIRDERDEHLWKIKQALKRYLVDEQILKDMEFEVHEGHRKGDLVLSHDTPNIPLVEMLEKEFQFRSWFLMNFKREEVEGGYIGAYIEVNQWSISITLPKDITKEELTTLKEKYGFTINVCRFADNLCRSKERTKSLEEKMNRFS